MNNNEQDDDEARLGTLIETQRTSNGIKSTEQEQFIDLGFENTKIIIYWYILN